MSDERVGSSFGHYELRSVLGRGGMGVVYEAYDHVHDRVVALKLLPHELAQDDSYRDRFRREARTAGRLGEPHIIPIHDFGEIDGTLYIDMRLVRGRDLRALLRDQGRMTPARALDLLSQVGAALDAAHADGLVHRDVKPENIMVTSGGFAYLADFGIAARVDDRRLTQAGSALGSFRYMAPERFSDAPVTAASDIYSLGCVLHECLTGNPPFNQQEVSSLIRAHLTDPPPRLSTGAGDGAIPEIAAKLQPVLSRALAKSPGHRYSSAGQMMDDARNALARDARAASPSEPTRMARTMSAPGAVSSRTAAAPMRPAPHPAPRPTPHHNGNGNRGLWAVAVAVLVIALASGGWLVSRSFGAASDAAASMSGAPAAVSTGQPGTQSPGGAASATGQPPPGTVTVTATTTPEESATETTDSAAAAADLHGPTIAPNDQWTYQGWSDDDFARCHATDRATLIAGGGDIRLVVCEVATGESGRYYYLGHQTGTGHIEIPTSSDQTINGNGSDWVMSNKGTTYTITQGNLTITRPDGTTQTDRTLDTFETP